MTALPALDPQPLLWLNPQHAPAAAALPALPLQAADIDEAHARWARWAPALAHLFPELQASGGLIESPLSALAMERLLPGVPGRLLLKQDHALAVAGSVKARGGIHEVLCIAEDVLRHEGIDLAADPLAPVGERARAAFARRTVSVGSTGNLGLAIGTAAAGLGFRAVVHMSDIAKEWKKQRLRERGVQVREHAGDFTQAVDAGRREAQGDAMAHFVDDERSTRLFLGYATAARRLAAQLGEQGVAVDAAHPLFVYLPCGVGGAPSGIAFGLKHLFGDAVHCFYAEPCAAPSMLARLAVGAPVSVYALGLDNRTEADGLAVAQASELAAQVSTPLVSGIYTVRDETLHAHVAALREKAGLRIEPSAAAGFPGPQWLAASLPGRIYLRRHGLDAAMAQATHLVWTTGGLFLPG